MHPAGQRSPARTSGNQAMHRRAVDRLPPIVAGVAGLGWFWAELAPQRAGFPDTDAPAVSLQFLAAHPEAWTQAGVFLGIAALALLATVVTRWRDDSGAPRETDESSMLPTVVALLGVLSGAMLLGMAVVRLGGGPLRYVDSLDHVWGEAAYLVTQFVGVHLLAVGGLVLLTMWITGVAWLGARRGSIPRVLAWLAIVPLLRLVMPAFGWAGISVDELWPLYMAAVPAGW